MFQKHFLTKMGFNLTLTQIHIHLVGPQSCLVNHIFPKLNGQNPRSWTIMKPYWWYTYPSEKYKFVTWDYDIPNIWKIKFKFQTTNQHITCVLGWTPCCSLETHALNRPSIQPTQPGPGIALEAEATHEGNRPQISAIPKNNNKQPT